MENYRRMTLREEIMGFMHSPVRKEALRYKTDYEFEEYLTNEILSIIVKRIDEIKTEYPNELYRAYNAGLDDIKEEMLK